MQRLEVSGAVRPIYGSLGVKRLRWIKWVNVWMEVCGYGLMVGMSRAWISDLMSTTIADVILKFPQSLQWCRRTTSDHVLSNSRVSNIRQCV